MSIGRLWEGPLVLWIALVLLPSICLADDGHRSRNTCDGRSIEHSKNIDLPGTPFGVASTSDDCWVFVTMETEDPPNGPSGIAVLERKAGNLTLHNVVPVGGSGVALTHDNKLLIVAAGSLVRFFDVEGLIAGSPAALVGSISDGFGAGSVYVSVTNDDRNAFVSDEESGTITVIDLVYLRAHGYDQQAIVGKIPMGRGPIAVTLSPDNRLLYTTSQLARRDANFPKRCPEEGDHSQGAPLIRVEGVVNAIDVSRALKDPQNAVISTVPAGCSPVRLALSPDGRVAWVTARNGNAVIAFDTTRLASDPAHAEIGSVPVGLSPVGLAVSPDGKHVWVANSHRLAGDENAHQSLSIIEASPGIDGNFKVIGSIAAGVFPREMHFLKDGTTLLVTNYSSKTVQVIDTVHDLGAGKSRQ